MRIGFEAKRATHNFRGLGNYSRGVIEGLMKYNPKEELILYSPLIKNERAQNWTASLASNVKFKYPPTFLKEKFPAFWRSFLMASDLKKHHLDIFHGLSHEIPYFLSGSMPYKKVVTMHDLIFLRYPEFFPLIDRIVYKEKFNYACKNSDVVIAICEQTKQDLIKILNVDEKKIIVHYQSCAPLFYHSLEQSQIAKLKQKYSLKKPFIINVGAFEERKNQLGLLLAYAEISNQVEEDLVFVGQGKKYKDRVKERSHELKLSHRVHFLDAVSFDELPAVYQAASVFCFPSLFEGFGIPIIEALFSKTPVITSFGSCFPESAGPDSFFVDPLSLSSIANGLIKVLGDQNLKNKMSLNGLEYVQRFHLENSTSELMKIYNQVLS